MQLAQWKTFIAQFAELNRRQRLAGIALLHGAASQDVAVALIESVARQQPHCPVCNSNHAHRHGHAHGLQRYRCVPCGRTFNALTGTPLARLRHKALWLKYADCMLTSDSVRKAALQLGCAPQYHVSLAPPVFIIGKNGPAPSPAWHRRSGRAVCTGIGEGIAAFDAPGAAPWWSCL